MALVRNYVRATSSSHLRKNEVEILDRVVQDWQAVSVLNNVDDLRTAEFQSAADMFLLAVESAVRAFEAPIACRTYRSNWTENYRQMFAEGTQRYNAHLFAACMEQRLPDIWLNGLKFEHSDESINAANVLRDKFSYLGRKAESWQRSQMKFASSPTIPSRKMLRTMFAQIDDAWAAFEQLHIRDLIRIEEAARDLLVQASKQEAHVHKLQQLGEAPQAEVECLVEHVVQLHRATYLGRGGGLSLARRIMGMAAALSQAEGKTIDSYSGMSASKFLALEAMESFDGVCWYLSKVPSKMRWVDPCLKQNRGLVERLDKWAESCEVAAEYLLPCGIRESMDSLVTQFRRAGEVSEAFVTMCETHDVELFLVIPRLTWLFFLLAPEPFTPLLEKLLPHRFNKDDEELARLFETFRSVVALLEPHALVHLNREDEIKDYVSIESWRTLVMYAIGAEDHCSEMKQALNKEVCDVIRKLMRDLEAWSMELQRHYASEWNQCIAVLVRCLAGQCASESYAMRRNYDFDADDFYV